MRLVGVLAVVLAIVGGLWWYAGMPESYVYRKAPATVGAQPEGGGIGNGKVEPK